MKQRLLWKLLLANLPVIAVIILIIWLSIDHLAANYFMVLMDKYMVEPTATHHAFLQAIHRTLIGATLAALAVALLLSYLITRRVLRPLLEMTRATRDVAAGHFSARVAVASRDEVGTLGNAFNRMADSLEQLEKLRKTMVADVAHELRTPLTNLRGYLEGLSDEVISPDQPTFRMLQQEILRLVHLVDDLQQLARADAASAFLDRQTLKPVELIDQLLALYRQEIEAKRLHVSVDIPPNAIVSADRDKLLQALRNLLDNACKYTPAGETLQITALRSAGELRLTFTNRGVEIPAAELPLIFERFYRLDPSRSRDAGGAGIGLAIVKQLIEAHGGTVGAASGHGETRIWISLPDPPGAGIPDES